VAFDRYDGSIYVSVSATSPTDGQLVKVTP
jgi:hypothetical protein